MNEFRQKRDFNKKIFSPISVAVALIIAIILIISTFKIYIKSRNVQTKNDKMAQELADVEKRKAALEAEAAKISTESGLEEEIRDKFSVKKPGEEVLTIMEKRPEGDKINSGENQGFFGNLPRFLRGIWEFVKNIF